jgi:glycolate oxidase
MLTAVPSGPATVRPVAPLATLSSRLSPGAVITDPDRTEGFRRDQARTVPAGRPLAVIRVRSTAEVSATLRWAQAHGVPVVPRGAGSGLAGGANAVDGGLVLDLTPMDRILEIDPVEQLAVVQPGVINGDLARAAASHGLSYPPDPASRDFSTLGGNLATNAGGLCCLKYGVTADYVLALEVVMADGSVVHTGRRTLKGVTGLDLTRLFVGSEGTLGVITEATLRLRPSPPPPATLVAFFPDLPAAGAAIAGIAAAGLVPSMLEIMDRTTVAVVDTRLHMDLDRDAAALLLARSDAGVEAPAEIVALASICRQQGATYVAETTDVEEGEALLAARRAAYPALEALGATLLDDVAVPRGRIPDLIAAIERIAADRGVLIGTFGHAGDGNLHPTVVFDPFDPVAAGAAASAFDDILTATLRLGGTITGEHGIGLLKRHRLGDELDDTVVALQRIIKNALDPAGLLNPGKAI